jgi:hypothetical protein
MRHVVMFSGGVGSWLAARRVVTAHGAENTTLLFCDTRMEDPSLYEFLTRASEDVGAELVTVSDGRTPWQVFFDERYLGNTRADPCSKILKRNLADRWMRENFSPETVIRHVGIDWTESHRLDRLRERLAPWVVEAPLCDPPYLDKQVMLGMAREAGLPIPRLYEFGFAHNNCGGFCVKAGQAHFRLLLEKLPEVYAFHEGKEQEIREFLDKDVAILRDRRGGKSRPMTLREFRERIQGGEACDPHEWGGCGCMVDEPEPIEPDYSGLQTNPIAHPSQ